MMLLLFFLPLAFAKKPEDRKFDLKGPLAEVADEFMVREVLLLREYGAYARGLMGGAIRSSSDMSDGVHPPVTSKVFQSMGLFMLNTVNEAQRG
ncbi:uncharacterized protein BcabD6B2_16280 [Babesia caballi]|uniref:Uncharacterized protein n=1 Tax=Babesia caballi TaxID=5871 RepID=A0AAV4LR44_BABCB|nr:hypothetical protein BcabD6B2_16280 [Babesia caballi]